MRYDTILFDADGTLLDFKKSEREAAREALQALGVCVTEEMLDRYNVINDGLWKQLERGLIEKKRLVVHRFELLAEEFGCAFDPEVMSKEYMARLQTKGYWLEGAEDLCRILRQKYRLYIITNGTEIIQKRRFAQCGLMPYFEDVFISDVIGAQKPSEKFFDYVADHIPTFDPCRTLVIGDSLSSDILGGIRYGLDTCWFNPDCNMAPAELEGRITYTVSCFDALERLLTKGENDVD